MALRNAFEAMATESTLKRLETTLTNLFRNLTLAKTSNDVLRVVIDSGANDIAAVRWGANNSWPTYYSTGAGSSMDLREQQREASVANFNAVRSQRWSL